MFTEELLLATSETEDKTYLPIVWAVFFKNENLEIGPVTKVNKIYPVVLVARVDKDFSKPF